MERGHLVHKRPKFGCVCSLIKAMVLAFICKFFTYKVEIMVELLAITGQERDTGVQVLAFHVGDPGLIPDTTFGFLTPAKCDPRTQ